MFFDFDNDEEAADADGDTDDADTDDDEEEADDNNIIMFFCFCFDLLCFVLFVCLFSNLSFVVIDSSYNSLVRLQYRYKKEVQFKPILL